MMKLKLRTQRTLMTAGAITLALWLLLTLTGCASLKHSAQTAVAADGVTTVIGVASGVAVEANPLFASPAGLVVSIGARWLILNEIDKLPEEQRVPALAKLSSFTWGIAASNLAVIAAASNPIGLIAGLIVGLSVWQSTADQRAFAEACAYFRQETPDIKCSFELAYTKVTP